MSSLSRRLLGLAVFAVASVFASVALPVLAAPPARPSRQYTIEQFLATTSISGASFSADEKKILFSSNKTGIFNVYSISVAGGVATPITASETDTTRAVSYFPGDDRVLYTRDKGGDEKNHLYVRELDGKEKDLTPGDNLKAGFRNWSHSGDAFCVQSNERDPKAFDLYRYATDGYARSLVFQNDGAYEIESISNDGQWLALGKPNSTADRDLYVWNAAAKKAVHISRHEGTAEYTGKGLDPASRWLYYTTNDGGEFARLKRYELKSGKHEEVQKADWDIAWTFFSHNGRYRLTGVNQDARTVLDVADAKTGKPVPMPSLPPGEISAVSVSRSEKTLAFLLVATAVRTTSTSGSSARPLPGA